MDPHQDRAQPHRHEAFHHGGSPQIVTIAGYTRCEVAVQQDISVPNRMQVPGCAAPGGSVFTIEPAQGWGVKPTVGRNLIAA